MRRTTIAHEEFKLDRPSALPALSLLFAAALSGCTESNPSDLSNDGGASALDMPSQCMGNSSPRSDTPAYGARGAYPVGFKVLQRTAEHRAEGLTVKIWYPAEATSTQSAHIEYPISFKSPDWQNFTPAVVIGNSISEAKIIDGEQSYPVVVFSHGYALSPEIYSEFVEHLASHGYIVIAPEHDESDWFSAAGSLFSRPLDVQLTLDFVEEINENDTILRQAFDLDRISVVGHSFGGYTALAIAGARLDWKPFDEYCGALAPEAPETFVCAPFMGESEAIAQLAGLSEPPEGLWPSQADPRVKAVISLAGDAYMFGPNGLESIQVPLLAMGGMSDFGTPWELGAEPAFQHAASDIKILIGLEGGNHMLPATRCEFLPWSAQLEGFAHSIFCEDPVWDKQRARELFLHYSTAFLNFTLNEDDKALEALTPPGSFNPGVVIESTLK